MKQRSFLFDPNLCLGCHACQMACAVNRGLAQGIFWRKVTLVEFVSNEKIMKYFLSSSCNQCENPECIRLCTQKACRKRHDGIVILDPDRCTNCGICLHSCPFEAPVRDPISGKISKCDFCYTRLDSGDNPYCIDACPVGALQLIELPITGDDASTLISALSGVPKIQLTRPSVRYRALQMGQQMIQYLLPKKGG